MHKKETIDKLSKDELSRLNVLKQQELEKDRGKQSNRFDSNKNWSIMINQKDNEVRNQIMMKIKFEQEKRRFLHDFERKTREKIIKDRQELLGDEVSEQGSLEELGLTAQGSMSAATAISARQ